MRPCGYAAPYDKTSLVNEAEEREIELAKPPEAQDAKGFIGQLLDSTQEAAIWKTCEIIGDILVPDQYAD